MQHIGQHMAGASYLVNVCVGHVLVEPNYQQLGPPDTSRREMCCCVVFLKQHITSDGFPQTPFREATVQTQELRERLRRTEDALGCLSCAAAIVLLTLEQLGLDEIGVRLEDGRRTTTGHALRYALDVAKPVNEAMEAV